MKTIKNVKNEMLIKTSLFLLGIIDKKEIKSNNSLKYYLRKIFVKLVAILFKINYILTKSS